MTKLSVALATYNEEKNIDRCLKSVSFADEIVIVDESSTDKTRDLAKKYTKKIVKVPKQENFHITKQTAIDTCSGDWIFVIDADEEVTPELKAEILSTIVNPGNFAGFELPRKNKIFGKWFEHTGFYPDYQVRLFKKGTGTQPTDSFHAMIKVAGPLGKLTKDLLHYHYQTIENFITRLNRYTTNDAAYILAKGEKVYWYDALRYPADEFLKRFFFWAGYKDGLHGLVLSLLQALSRAVVFAKIWEQQKFWEHDLGGISEEFKKIGQDFNYYQIQQETDPLKKLGLKIKRKIQL